MAKTTFILEADEAKAVNAFLKVVEAQKKTAAGMTEITRKSDETKKSFLGMEGGLKGVAGALGIGGSIAGGIAFLRQQTQAWGEDVRLVIEKYTNVNKELIKAVSQSGDLANFPEIQEKLKTISMPGIGLTERTGIYQSLRRELPLEFLETIMKLLPEAGKANIFEDPKEFAARMGTTYDIYAGKLKPDDVADTAKIVGDLLGANAEKYGTQVFKESMQLRAMGMDPDKALAMLIAAANQGQLKGISTVRGLLTTEKILEPRKFGQRFTKEQKIEREFYAIEDPEERFRWLMANQGKGGKTAAVLQDQGVLAAISEVDIAGVANQIKTARERNYFDQMRRLALGRKPGSTLLKMEEVEALKERTEAEAGEIFTNVKIARDMFDVAGTRALKARLPFAPLIKTIDKAILETDMFLGVEPKVALEATVLGGKYLTPQEQKQAFSEQTLSSEDIRELTKAVQENTKVQLNKQNTVYTYHSPPGPEE